MENQNQNSGQSRETINIQVPSIDNITSRRPVIPASFALAILFFFFTFCDFKCGGQKIASVTGMNLVTGTEIQSPEIFPNAESEGKEISSNIWAILALGAAIIGLGAFLIKEKREDLIGTGAGAIGAGSLILLQVGIRMSIDSEGQGQIAVEFQFAYWGALLSLGIAGLICYLRMRKTHDVVVNIYPPPSKTGETEES